MLGAVIALLSAFAFSLNGVLVRRGVVNATAAQGAFITVLMGVPLFALAALVAGQLFRLSSLSLEDYGLLAAAGMIHFVVGRYFNYQAIAAIGASRTGPIQALQIPYSIIVALIFLGEDVTLWMAVGIVLVMLGPAVMIERKKPAPVSAASAEPPTTSPATTATLTTAPKVELRQVEGYACSILSAVMYGTSPILIRAALEGHSGLSVLGGLVSYTAAALLLIASVLLPSQRTFVSTLRPSTVRVFTGAGVSIFLAQMFRFVALSMASVAVVSTLQRASVVFTLILSWVMNRQLEFITPRLVLSVVVSVAGAVLLVFASS
jgi:drug/metabolite transporter (DMT)-like permease